MGFVGIKIENPGIFIPKKSPNPGIFIPQKSKNPEIWDPGKIPSMFRPFPEKFLSFLCLFNLHNFLYNHPIPFPIFTKKIDVARPLLHEGRKARVNKIYLSPPLYDTPTRPHNLEISFQFLQAFNSLFLAKKETAKNAEFTRAIFATFQPTPCPKDQLFSYLCPTSPKNLIFSIKLVACESNEGLTVSLG